MAAPSTRLYLMTPPLSEPGEFAASLEAALDAGDVACVLVMLAARDEGSAKKIVRALLPVTEPRGVALLIDSVGLVARSGADGAHVRLSGDTLEKTLGEAVERLKPDRILGAGSLRAKHDAMISGEHDIDYVSFGDPAPDGYVPPLEQVVERVSWWSEIFNVPCVAYAPTLPDVTTLTRAGADFISLREAVWDDARGPAAAVSEASSLIANAGVAAA
ncbi:MAG: thiamine phosphate synthase [Beijerinckiaceae bacterium]|jgi:thiamine-phosphate pyrophosphorylase|nr:thiamine phosphate synthase [Beijerinckiaceae bacterium]MDO9443284.1 thiamine phosphate synthase [Beijerinckiaceae bacterium]